MDESKRALERKLEGFKEQQKRLSRELKKKYCPTKWRELNIVDHHIRVVTERLNNEWFTETNKERITIVN